MVDKKEVVDALDQILDEVTVNWGAEKISPIQYNTMDIGPFSMRTKVRPGETAEEAMARAYAACRNFAMSTFAGKRDAFIAEVRAAAQAARGR